MQSHINSGVIQFTTHPTNQTVNYGDFVTFECRLQVDDRSHILLSYIGNTNVQNDRSSLADLDRREFSANVSGTVGRVSMLVNSRTLELFDNFWCRAVYVQHQHIDSAVAYINVRYPECNALQSQPSLAVTTQPLSVAATTASTPQDVKPTCTCDPIGSNGMCGKSLILFFFCFVLIKRRKFIALTMLDITTLVSY